VITFTLFFILGTEPLHNSGTRKRKNPNVAANDMVISECKIPIDPQPDAGFVTHSYRATRNKPERYSAS